MNDVTLEKVDIVRERTGVSYAEAKEALEMCQGNVVDALVYLESSNKKNTGENFTTKDEFVNWVKELINKGNVTRIKIKREEKVLLDIPVNAGIAVAGIAAIISSTLLAIGIITAVVAKITIEITKEDGSVEIVNKLIQNTFDDVKDKFSGIKDDVKDKFGDMSEVKDKMSNITEEVKDKMSNITMEVKEKFTNKNKTEDSEGNVYKYTVKFDDVNDDTNKE
jgi:hypothetical protein